VPNGPETLGIQVRLKGAGAQNGRGVAVGGAKCVPEPSSRPSNGAACSEAVLLSFWYANRALRRVIAGFRGRIANPCTPVRFRPRPPLLKSPADFNLRGFFFCVENSV